MEQILNVSDWIQKKKARPYLNTDSTEQQKLFQDDPLEYLKYCKQIESELNQRFKFILNGTPEAAQAKKA